MPDEVGVLLVPLDPEGAVDGMEDDEPQPAAAAVTTIATKGTERRGKFMPKMMHATPEQRLTIEQAVQSAVPGPAAVLSPVGATCLKGRLSGLPS